MLCIVVSLDEWYFQQACVQANICVIDIMLRHRALISLPAYTTVRKPGGFQWSALAWDALGPSYACVCQ